MKEIGEYLKNKRKELGISLDDAEQYLKIRKKYLIAIEEGDENVLPGRTYFVGYLRNYASYLEADQDYINQLLGETNKSPVITEDNNKKISPAKTKTTGHYFSSEKRKYRTKKEKKSINYNQIFKIILVALLIVAIIFIINKFLDKIKQPSTVIQPENNIVSENNIDEEKTIEQELTEIAEENLQNEIINEQEPTKYLETIPEYKPITIKVTDNPTWVKITQNDRILFESIVFSSEDITIKSNNSITLETTSSDSVNVFYDGELIEPEPADNLGKVYYEIISQNENS